MKFKSLSEQNRSYYLKNKEEILKRHKKNYFNNQEKKKKYAKEYRLKNKEKIKKDNKKYYLKNREKLRQYYLDNKEYYINYSLNYGKKRRKNDPSFRIAHNLRTRTRNVLKGISKSKSTLKLLGCSIDQLWEHLEKKFKSGMTKKNYGLWHVDHIKPCASFDLSKLKEQAKCFHYTNLQPLWAKENISKGAKYEME